MLARSSINTKNKADIHLRVLSCSAWQFTHLLSDTYFLEIRTHTQSYPHSIKLESFFFFRRIPSIFTPYTICVASMDRSGCVSLVTIYEKFHHTHRSATAL